MLSMLLTALKRRIPLRLALWRAVLMGNLALFSYAAYADAPKAPAGKSAAISAESIAQLIDQLDDDVYAVRQEATRKLANSGIAAIAPLTKAATGENLEAAFRAFAALKELGCADDEATKDAAFTAIESLAQANATTAVRAQTVLVSMRRASQARAIERLLALGAVIKNDGEATGDSVAVWGAGGGVIAARGMFIVTPDGGQYVTGAIVEIGESFKGTAADLRLLRRLDNIGKLDITGERVTDEWVSQLPTASSLQWVSLRKTSVTDAGIAHLAKAPALAQIEIMYSPVTDKGLDALANVGSIQSIRLIGTKVTTEGAAKLSAALPNALVDRRSGALLGVGGAKGQPTCLVTEVRPDSAAAKADIREEDTIIKFDGQAVQDFGELTAAISKKTGGEKVEIELLRPGVGDAAPKQMTVTVTLGSW
jgi:hypothetical protein